MNKEAQINHWAFKAWVCQAANSQNLFPAQSFGDLQMA
jgi:hypothetical protein